MLKNLDMTKKDKPEWRVKKFDCIWKKKRKEIDTNEVCDGEGRPCKKCSYINLIDSGRMSGYPIQHDNDMEYYLKIWYGI